MGEASLERSKDHILKREITSASITGKRPKVIPVARPLPPFQRLGAVMNFKSRVRGRLDYNHISQVREIINQERRKMYQNRIRAEKEISQKCWKRFELYRIPSSTSTSHFMRAVSSYIPA